MGENGDGDTDEDHLVENNGEGDNMMVTWWFDADMGEKHDADTNEDHLVENDGEGVANATTGAMEHKRKGLVVTGKEGWKGTKNVQLF